MNFLAIPVEVVDKHILPYLSWNELLRLRRVSKATKAVVNGYIRVNPNLVPEIEICEDGNKSFRAFLEMNLPTTRIFLNSLGGQEFYEKNNEDRLQFLEKFAPLLKHLRVHQISFHLSGKELDFMGALVNLESFEAAHYGVWGKKVELLAETQRNFTFHPIPEDLMLLRAQKDPRNFEPHNREPAFDTNVFVFRNLKSVKIGQVKNIHFRNTIHRIGGFFRFGSKLESLALPFNHYHDNDLEEFQKQMGFCFKMLATSIEGHNIMNIEPFIPNLKVIDFFNYHDIAEMDMDAARGMDVVASENFLRLLTACVKKNVILKNVNPFWFVRRLEFPELSDPDLGTPVVSLVNLHPAMLPMNMENLEKIEIRATSRSCGKILDGMERPDWPNLKYLDITVDSKHSNVVPDWRRPYIVPLWSCTKDIYNILFQNISRTNLVELRLKFEGYAEAVVVPKTEEIVESCPNLKKLIVINWVGTNKALMKLFEGLKGLEEIELEDCAGLGNVAFVGLDTRDPVFLKLTKLRKLSLKGLDKMPKITDLLFTLVICHLKLTHFTLTSDSPIKSVSVSGIMALLEGNFAETIQKFSFKDWKLANVSGEEFKKLEASFRSNDML